MATNQQHTESVPLQEGSTIDGIPKVSPLGSDEETSWTVAQDSSKEIPNSAVDALSKNAAPKIDPSPGPAMVTPLKQLQREPKWVDCPFCKRMAKTKVQHKEEREEPSGAMMCVVCLVCCPLLLCLPQMMNKTESWIHTCSNCNAVVAIRGQLGQIEVKEPLPSKEVPSKYGAANDVSL